MGKRRRGHGRAAAQQSSDDGESSGDESVSGVWELDVEELRGRLAAQPKLTPEPEIEDAKASIVLRGQIRQYVLDLMGPRTEGDLAFLGRPLQPNLWVTLGRVKELNR